MNPAGVLYLGEWESFSHSIDDGSVSLIVTDPPYKSTPQSWDRKRPEWSVFMNEMARMCGSSGQMWIFCRMPWTVDVMLAAENAGWRYVQERIWVKQNAGGCTTGGLLRKVHETIVHFKRPEAKTFNQNAILEHKITSGNKSVKRRGSSETQYLGVNNSSYEDDGTRLPKSVTLCRNVHRTAEATGHPTQKPISVITPLVLYSSNPGDLVFDPYVGTGTTLVSSFINGRRWAGAEKDPSWHAVAQGRMSKLIGGGDLFSE